MSMPLHKFACVPTTVAVPADHCMGHSLSPGKEARETVDAFPTALIVMGGAGKIGSIRPCSPGGCPLHQQFPLPCFIFFYCRMAPVCGH
jgi:hypothetical protein